MLINILSNSKLSNNKYDNYHNLESNKVFGFWIYLMSDCILFSVLFSVYFILNNNIASGPTKKDILNISIVLIETFFLLLSNFTLDIAMLSIRKNKKKIINIFLWLTFLLGFCFIYIELYDFYFLISKNYKPNCSAFLSSFFTLMSVHGIHVFFGLIWVIVMIIQIYYYGLNIINKNRMICLSLFWHFLDIIWIFIFTIVYLMGNIL